MKIIILALTSDFVEFGEDFVFRFGLRDGTDEKTAVGLREANSQALVRPDFVVVQLFQCFIVSFQLEEKTMGLRRTFIL